MLDASGAALWQREVAAGARALTFTSDGALVEVSNTELRGRSAAGDLLWSVALGVDELSVRDLVVLGDGGIVVAGHTPGDVGECSEVWLGLYR